MTDFRRANRHTPRDEYATKPELWRPLKTAIGGFDLDPAAGCEPEQIATTTYTPRDDGLSKPWYGKVWLNPPFSEKTQWYKRLYNQYHNGKVTRAIAVCPSDTSTSWFQDWICDADVLGFPDGRDWFVRNPGNGQSPSFSTTVAVWNPTSKVIDVLTTLGIVYESLNTDPQQRTL